jgi:dCMP deaminase
MPHRKFPRSTTDEWFVLFANMVASRSTCPRFHAGAVIVSDKRIVSTGYNGSTTGDPHCEDVGCLVIQGHCKRTVHAEKNAIINAARVGLSTIGTTIYVKGQPCIDCAKDIVNAGIVRVVYDNDHGYHRHKGEQSEEQREAMLTFQRNGLQVIEFSGDFLAPLNRFLSELSEEELKRLQGFIANHLTDAIHEKKK